MSAGRGIVRAGRWLAVPWLLAGSLPLAASAQMVNDKDPCYAPVFGRYQIPPLLSGSWTSVEDVSDAVARIRRTSADMFREIQGFKAQAATGSLAAGDRIRLQGYLRCLPWLRELLRRAEDAMKSLGINTVGSGDDRGRPPIDRDRLLADILAELAESQRLLSDLLRSR
jgi:hypothetical protein